MFRDLLEQQKGALDHFFSCVETVEAEKLIEQIVGLQGNLIFTGIGKSGQIAKKLASTFTSTGTKAFFLHPVEALHGDMGIVNQQDLVIHLSKSGETCELIALAQILEKRGVSQILWVCKRFSQLSQWMDAVCYLPLKSELCPFNLSPTTSPLLQMWFGDTLAIAVMQKKQISLDQYAANHPGGFIGKRAQFVAEVMRRGEVLPLVKVDQPIREIVVEMSEKRLGCVLVTDENAELVGIFTTGDLNRVLVNGTEQFFQSCVGDWMTTDFLRIEAFDRLDQALELMQNPRKRVQMLPVFQDNRLVGLLHLHDVVESRGSSFKNNHLKEKGVDRCHGLNL